MGKAKKPPPKTVPKRASARKFKDARLDVQLAYEVVGDATDPGVKGGVTTFKPVGGIPDGKGGNNLFTTPGYQCQIKNGRKIIQKLNGPVVIKGTVRIQTVYGPNADPAHDSAYGRGTSVDDEKNGDTSLGFHESCHRDDYISYLKTKPLPKFGGRIGMTEREYNQAAADFQKALQKYFEEMDRVSDARTDEVGYKKSTYDKTGPRP